MKRLLTVTQNVTSIDRNQPYSMQHIPLKLYENFRFESHADPTAINMIQYQ